MYVALRQASRRFRGLEEDLEEGTTVVASVRTLRKDWMRTVSMEEGLDQRLRRD